MNTIYYHLPGLFEFYELYKVFLPLYTEHPEYFYDNVRIASIYGAPAGCIFAGGRTSSGTVEPKDVFEFLNKYHISARLTLSNSLLKPEHLNNKEANELCHLFHNPKNGIIIHSPLLLKYLKENYPDYHYISSTTKVITDVSELIKEIDNPDYRYVVPDYRLNKVIPTLNLTQSQKDKVEFLVNECCYEGCKERKQCYENVSRLILGENVEEHICKSPGANEGYRFSKAMKNPSFISLKDIIEIYIPAGFTNFKIEGRGLGSALVLEFLLYYLVKPQYQIHIREAIYLDNMLDLF